MKGTGTLFLKKIGFGMLVLSFVAVSGLSEVVVVENHSFESPQVDPNAFQALPYVEQWIEKDNDSQNSANTGVFPNPGGNNPGHLANSDGGQLAFLGSEQGNSISQDLAAQYEPGYAYRLRVGVGISGMFPPSELNSLELAFYYVDANEPNVPIDIALKHISVAGLSSSELVDFSLYTPVAQNQAWAGRNLGIAVRSVGPASGFWDLDDVRVEELQTIAMGVENASFEAPVVDPLAFPALPYVIQWTELDNDTEASANTGVFPNPASESPGHLAHANEYQLAFLGSEQGNALEQRLQSAYKPGFAHQLAVGVGVSAMYPPSA